MLAPQAIATRVSPLSLFALDVWLGPGDGQGARGLEDGARVLEHVLDGGAGRVGIDEDDLVDQVAAEAEGLLADLLDGDAVGEKADLVEPDAACPPRATAPSQSESAGSTPIILISGLTRLT